MTIRQRDLTLADMRGENALSIIATMDRLLRRLVRESGAEQLKSMPECYRTEAMSGDYEHLCAVTERYALQYLATTLAAREGDLTDDNDDEQEEGWA
jgi:hypothetical protein